MEPREFTLTIENKHSMTIKYVIRMSGRLLTETTPGAGNLFESSARYPLPNHGHRSLDDYPRSYGLARHTLAASQREGRFNPITRFSWAGDGPGARFDGINQGDL